MPLRFVGNSSMRWGGVGGEEVSWNAGAKGWDVDVGTIPAGIDGTTAVLLNGFRQSRENDWDSP